MKVTIQSHNIINAARHIQLLGEMFGFNYPNPYAAFEILIKAEREANRRATLECNQSFSEEESDKWHENFIKRLTKKSFRPIKILATMRRI